MPKVTTSLIHYYVDFIQFCWLFFFFKFIRPWCTWWNSSLWKWKERHHFNHDSRNDFGFLIKFPERSFFLFVRYWPERERIGSLSPIMNRSKSIFRDCRRQMNISKWKNNRNQIQTQTRNVVVICAANIWNWFDR